VKHSCKATKAWCSFGSWVIQAFVMLPFQMLETTVKYAGLTFTSLVVVSTFSCLHVHSATASV
jgi:hypothetical protein